MIAPPPPILKPLPILVDNEHAGELTSTSGRNVNKLVAEGMFPPFVILGQSRRWRSAEIIAWADAGCPPMSDWQWPPPKAETASQHSD